MDEQSTDDVDISIDNKYLSFGTTIIAFGFLLKESDGSERHAFAMASDTLITRTNSNVNDAEKRKMQLKIESGKTSQENTYKTIAHENLTTNIGVTRQKVYGYECERGHSILVGYGGYAVDLCDQNAALKISDYRHLTTEGFLEMLSKELRAFEDMTLMDYEKNKLITSSMRKYFKKNGFCSLLVTVRTADLKTSGIYYFKLNEKGYDLIPATLKGKQAVIIGMGQNNGESTEGRLINERLDLYKDGDNIRTADQMKEDLSRILEYANDYQDVVVLIDYNENEKQQRRVINRRGNGFISTHNQATATLNNKPFVKTGEMVKNFTFRSVRKRRKWYLAFIPRPILRFLRLGEYRRINYYNSFL